MPRPTSPDCSRQLKKPLSKGSSEGKACLGAQDYQEYENRGHDSGRNWDSAVLIFMLTDKVGHCAFGKLLLSISVCWNSEGIQDKIREVLPNGSQKIQDFDNLSKINAHDM